jgi:N utilization substance protein A
LTGFDIQLVKEGSEYDIDLEEFKEELGEEIYTKFFDAGYETAKAVIDADIDELVEEIGVDAQKLQEIVALIKKEYEEAEVDEDEELPAEKTDSTKSSS